MLRPMWGRLLAAAVVAFLMTGCRQEISWAAKRGDTAKVRELLDAGADANSRDSDGMTALILAAGYGHPDVVKLLITAGADVGAETYEEQWTPLGVAAGEVLGGFPSAGGLRA